ncbi:MAG: SCP2 sterol-binding domain-containing protein [Candidatus Hadarchaeales archaeon]
MGEVAEGWKMFAELANQNEGAKKLMQGWDKVVQFVVDGEDVKEFYLEFKGGQVTFNVGKHPSPAFTMIGNKDIMWKLLTREEDATRAFMAKKYSIQGSLADAMKFGKIGQEVAKTAPSFK